LAAARKPNAGKNDRIILVVVAAAGDNRKGAIAATDGPRRSTSKVSGSHTVWISTTPDDLSLGIPG
jgi:hypothetical protein